MTAGAQTVKAVSEDIQAELAYLLSFVGPQESDRSRFDPEQIRHLLEFVATPKDNGIVYHAGKLNGGPSAYHDFSIQKNLQEILHIAYDPDIPAVMTSPSSLRLTRWKEVEGKSQPLPRFWEKISDLQSPLIVTGVEYTVNTPDVHSGTYYEYDLERTLILGKYRGKNVFISMSKQPQCSNVGKKGLVIGPDQNWEYLYSDQPGVGRSGLGWVRSYMYDSIGIIIYYETDPTKPLTRFAVFKWVRAGWKDINFVKRSHIYNGLLRFASDFKAILENPDLPEPSLLARSCASIRSLSDEQLHSIVEQHLEAIAQISRQEQLLPEATIEQMLQNRQYVNGLTRDEMENLVSLVYLKQLLGRGPHQRLTSLPVSSKLPR
jgi:hypothetical protein